MKHVIELDGAIGGGQVLRSALSLSMITGQPLHIHNIRARRSRPGLLRQHLTAVLAAAEICTAHTEGAQLHSQSLSFVPGPVRGGDYRFSIGTAGSCSLVLQTLLPALLQAPAPSRVNVTGGTHNPLAPPADFLQRAFVPLLQRMGAQVELELLRHGFVPAGGGELQAIIQPSALQPLHLNERGRVLARRATALSAAVAGHVAERELGRAARRLDLQPAELLRQVLDAERGPGNALLLEFTCEHLTELFSALGQASLRAEKVADLAVDGARRWLASEAAVAEHLADQLLLPMALAGGGSFTTTHVSEHLQSNISVIECFLPVRFECRELSSDLLQVQCLKTTGT
ncbi:RNA 3'-terminal phosphate cyclase [Pseudomonas sp. 21LCFQ010]|uniref:RNA 3'-terminal phosphate cyclase n=1 Tax=Pseudomonas sp. 21LCFQ010 TaxID=2957506 RepID=UPI00209854B7|nr:RNA 3'-terminal phosphate cyclase [Pseudomonas sp. 21LCFQ010]MCO8162212.1 RNA 3'-terminal phosphate cyclase [Pseudomonas sp. 21LCFQ010]